MKSLSFSLFVFTTSVSLSNADEAPITNSLGMKFAAVPATRVAMCIHETRICDYQAYAAAHPEIDMSWKNSSRNAFKPEDKDQLPVASVSWEDAQGFCKWLSEKEGKTYRLPTDAEWSFAVGLPEETGATPNEKHSMNSIFPWHGEYPPKPTDGNYGIPGVEDGYNTVAPVMKFSPNATGIYDLGGNVWEWCADWHDSSEKERVLRGADYSSSNYPVMYAAYRSHGDPAQERYPIYGFRIVMETGALNPARATAVVAPPPLGELEIPLPLSIIASGVEYPILHLNTGTKLAPGLPFSLDFFDLTMPNDEFKKWLTKSGGARQKKGNYSLSSPEKHHWREALLKLGMPERGTHEAQFSSRSMMGWVLLGCLSDSTLEKAVSADIHFHPPPTNEFERRDRLPAARKMMIEMAQRTRGVRTLSWVQELQMSDSEYDFSKQRFDLKERMPPVWDSSSDFFVTDAAGREAALARASLPEAEARRLFSQGSPTRMEFEVRARVKGIALYKATPRLWLEVEEATLLHRTSGISIPVRKEDLGVTYPFQRSIPPKLLPKAAD